MNWPVFSKSRLQRRSNTVSRPAPQPLRFVVDIRRIERRTNSSGSDLHTRRQTFFFLTNRRKFALGAAVLSLAVFFAALPARADIITFYPTSCLGGWVNPERAQGQFSVLDKGDGEMIGDDTFTRENSAVLEGSAAQIFCGSFNADVPEDATVSGFTLVFSWDFRDPQSGLSLPSPLSVDGTDYAFTQAAAAATAFYSSNDHAGTTTVAHATSTPVDVLPVATTTIVATDATSTANAILNLDTRQAAEVHIDLSTTTVVAEPQPEPQPQPSEPTAHAVEVVEPAANTAQVHNAVEAAAPEVTLPPVADPAPVSVPVEVPVVPVVTETAPVPAPVPAAEAAPAPSPEPVVEPSAEPAAAPQSFNLLLIFASVFGTVAHAQEAEVPSVAPVEVPVVVPAPTEQTPVDATPPAPSAPLTSSPSPSPAPSSTVIEPAVPDPVVPPEPAAVAVPESEIPSPAPVPSTTTSPSIATTEATTTATTSQEQEKTVVTQLSAIQDAPFLEVLYSIDGTTWRQIGTVSSQNWKYSRFALPITDWRDLEHLQISLQTMPVAGTMPSVYLDGLAVEANVLYSRKDPNPLPDLLADKLITQEVASSYRAALIRRVQDVGQVELWVSEVVDPRSLRVLSGKTALEAQLIQRALTSTSTSRFIRLSWRKVADVTLVGEKSKLATYQRSLFWTDAREESLWKYSLDSNSYESVSIDPISGLVEMDITDEAGQVVHVTYNKMTKNFVFAHVSDEGSDEN